MLNNRLLLFLTAIGASYIGIYILIVRPHIAPVSIFHTPAIRNPTRISPGYTLIAPYNNALNADPENKGAVYLIDMIGRAVHTWSADRQVFSAQLLPNGRLLIAMEAPRYTALYPGGGNTGIIQELDWDSRVIREIAYESAHHDVAVTETGNIAFAIWEKLPRSIAQKVRGASRVRKSKETCGPIRLSKLIQQEKSYGHGAPMSIWILAGTSSTPLLPVRGGPISTA